MNDVETYISERPDSALMVLDSIDRDLLITQKTKSHHALLYAMALDKNYIDVLDDSLAQMALVYYDKLGDKKYKARSYYYLGLANYYSQDYDKAILDFTKAECVAQKHDSLYWGMIKVAQADTYRKTYNEVEEYKNLLKSSEIFKKVSSYHYYVSLLRLSHVYLDRKEYVAAEEIYKAILNEDLDEKILANAIRCSAYLNVIKSDHDMESAVELYVRLINEYSEEYMTLKDYWALAYSLNCLNRKEESDELVSHLISVDTTVASEYWQYLFAKDGFDYKDALYHLEKMTEKNENEVSTALKQELSLKQRDYYASQTELISYKMHNRTLLLVFVIVFICMSVGYLLVFFREHVKKQQEEKNRYMEYVDEIARQLEYLNNEGADSLKRKYIDLYKSKYEVLRSLSDQYLQTENRVDAEEKMYKKVMSLVNEIRNDEVHRAKFEAMLDNDLGGIMTNFRNEFPKLKEIDYAIFSYWIIGFDATTISHLLDTSLNIVYIRKTRIKQQIKEKSPEHKEQFLEMIS